MAVIDLPTTLRARGMRVTSQRLRVHRALEELGRHATADEVRRAAGPGLSVPTVYATLELLVELGAARRVPAGTGAALYDPRTEPHAHLVCERCGAVSDVAIDGTHIVDQARLVGVAARDVEVILHGRCASCRD